MECIVETVPTQPPLRPPADRKHLDLVHPLPRESVIIQRDNDEEKEEEKKAAADDWRETTARNSAAMIVVASRGLGR